MLSDGWNRTGKFGGTRNRLPSMLHVLNSVNNLKQSDDKEQDSLSLLDLLSNPGAMLTLKIS